jgi:hypothetical protein
LRCRWKSGGPRAGRSAGQAAPPEDGARPRRRGRNRRRSALAVASLDLPAAEIMRPPTWTASALVQTMLQRRASAASTSAAGAPAPAPTADPVMPGRAPPAPIGTTGRLFDGGEVLRRVQDLRRAASCLRSGLPSQRPYEQHRRRCGEGNRHLTHRLSPCTRRSGACAPHPSCDRLSSRAVAGRKEQGRFAAWRKRISAPARFVEQPLARD